LASPIPITNPRAPKSQSGLSFAEVELPVEQDKNMNRNPISQVTPIFLYFWKSQSCISGKVNKRTHVETQNHKTLASGLNDKTMIGNK